MGAVVKVRDKAFEKSKFVLELELELELIQTQMTQKPMLRAEGECACVAQMACAKIRGRGRPSASKRERHLWVVSTLEMHTGRRLTCGTRSSIIAEVKNGFSAHRAPSALPPGKMPLKGKNSFLSLQSDSETRGPQKSTSCQWAACGLADPPNHRADP